MHGHVTRTGHTARMRIFIAEDQFLLRQGIEGLVTARGLTLAGTAEHGKGLVRAVEDSGADLALLDIRMPPSDTDEGVRAALELRRRRPGFPVVLLSQYVEQLYLDELLASGAGAVGYLLKDRVFDGSQFVRLLEAVGAGGTVVDPEVVARLRSRQPDSGPLAALTPREYEVLGLMAEGEGNERIAARLVVTDKAVQKHVNGIFAKLALPNSRSNARRVQAVLLYLGRGARPDQLQ